MDRNWKIGAAILITVVGVVAMLDASKLPAPRAAGSLGAAVMPFWVGAALLLLGLTQLLPAFRSSQGAVAEEAMLGTGVLLRVGSILLALVLYTLLAGWVGFFFSSWLFLAAGMKMLGNYSWWTVAGGGLAGSAIASVVFKVWLSLPLPAGPLGI